MMQKDTRGQVVQIAAIIAFAFAVLAFASYQATVVPQETAQAEQDHNQETKTDLQQLKRAIERTTTSGASDASTVQMAPRYPHRLLAINPPRRSGSLRTVPLVNDSNQAGIIIENASYPDSGDERYDRWNGTEREFETNRLEYRATYSRFQNPPTRVYEHALLYNAFENGAVVGGGEQHVIDGTTIRLTALRGDIDVSGTQARTIEPQPVSAPTESITVTGDGRNITLTLLTNLLREDWEEALAEEEHASVGSFSTDEKFNEVVIELDGNQIYDLQLGAVGLGETASSPEPTYIVDIRGNGTRVPEGATVGLTAEVRDEYDNPFVGEDVQAKVFVESAAGRLEETNNATVRPAGEQTNKTTSEDGEADFLLDIDENANDKRFVVVADINEVEDSTLLNDLVSDILNNPKPERVAFVVDSYDTDSGGGPGPPNGGGPDSPVGGQS